MTPLLSVSFRDYAVKMSGFNNAMRYTLKNAVIGTYPTVEIDYSLVLVSRGDLPNALNPTATSTLQGLCILHGPTTAALARQRLPTNRSLWRIAPAVISAFLLPKAMNVMKARKIWPWLLLPDCR